MRVCLICEGSYPYVVGGVAGWVQMLCKSFKNVEFVIWSIATTREEMSEYKYEIPPNVKEVSPYYPIPLLAGAVAGWIVSFVLLRRRLKNLNAYLLCR